MLLESCCYTLPKLRSKEFSLDISVESIIIQPFTLLYFSFLAISITILFCSPILFLHLAITQIPILTKIFCQINFHFTFKNGIKNVFQQWGKSTILTE